MAASIITQDYLDALDLAIATGASSVDYDGNKIVYRSLSDMERIRDRIAGSLGLLAPVRRPRTRRIVVSM